MKEKITQIIERSKLSFIMCIITLILSYIFIDSSLIFDGKEKIIVLLIGFVPVIVFLIITLAINYFYKKNIVQKALKILNILLIIILPMYYLIGFLACTVIKISNPIVNIKNYKYLVNGELLNVFPSSIPENVIDTRLTYSPALLQAGDQITLYYIDNNLNFEEFDNKYKEKAIWIGNVDDYEENKGLLTGIFSDTSVTYETENDFIIYLIEGKCDDSGYCNHGKFTLAAVNPKTNEVIYEYKYW